MIRSGGRARVPIPSYGPAATILSLGLLLGACATTRPPPELPADTLWDLRRPRVEALQQWAFSGRVAVRGAEASWNARMRWDQRGEIFDIDFLTPLGRQVAGLRGGDGRVVLRRPGEPPAVAPDAAALLESALGWSAPVDGLRYWLRGLPRPGAGEAPGLDAWGRVVWMAQDGWKVEIQRYVEIDGIMLPEKLTLNGPRLRIRLVVDEWRINQVTSEK